MDSPDSDLRVDCQVSDDGRSVCLRLDGEIDLGTARRVEEAFTPALDPRCTRLVVDLSDVSFMDSSGLRVLVMARNALDGRGGEMVIAHINDPLRRLFDMSGLTSAFTFRS